MSDKMDMDTDIAESEDPVDENDDLDIVIKLEDAVDSTSITLDTINNSACVCQE